MRELRTVRFWRYLVLSVVMVLAAMGLATGFGQDKSARVDAGTVNTITVVAGQSKVVTAPWPTVRVAITDPKIADVKILMPEKILLQGIKLGATDLLMWNKNETEVSQSKVIVKLDVDYYQEKFKQLFPHASLELNESQDILIVQGLLRSADEVAQLHDYLDKSGINYVDMTSLAGIQQVQLQVRIAEASRQAIRALGTNAFITGSDFFGAVRTGSAMGGALVPSISIGPPAGALATDSLDFIFPADVVASPLTTVLLGFPNADLEIFLSALVENQYLRILANPTLVALSGEQANFLAGGEFPVPIVQGSTAGGGTTITIEWKEFGVRLFFEPTVLGDGTIRLYTAPEVSQLSDVGAVMIEGFMIPSLVKRRAETTLELKSGQTFAMAGLIQRTSNAIASKIPWLGDVPVIGPLFRSVRYTSGETELIVLVTAHLVEPASFSTTPPLPGFLHSEPNDWEFYLEGRIERKAPAKLCPADAEWLKQMGLDELLGPGAWDSYDNPIVPGQALTGPAHTRFEYE